MPTIDVLDSTIHYDDHGSGATVVFLHGNPSSSHMWRKVLPLIGTGRLIAPDLIGMGRSGKPVSDYRFADHARYLEAFFDALGLDEVVLVGHDWGGSLAFDWAARHPGRVRGLAFFETIVRPIASSELSEQARARSAKLRTTEGEPLVLDSHFLINTAYTGGVLNPLSDEELDLYRVPYPTRESPSPAAELDPLAADRRRPRRRDRTDRCLRHLAGQQPGHPQTPTHLRLLTHPRHHPRTRRLVQGQHRRPPDRTLRLSRSPRHRRPARNDRHSDLDLAGPAEPPISRPATDPPVPAPTPPA